MLSGNGRHRRPRQAPALLVAAGVTGSAIAIPLLGAGAASAADGSTWDRVAECESGGSWSQNSGNGYYGGLQLAQGDWEKYGGLDYATSADQASRGQQIAVAEKILADQGVGAWRACGLLGGLGQDLSVPDVDTGTQGDSTDKSGPGRSATPSPSQSSDSSSDAKDAKGAADGKEKEEGADGSAEPDASTSPSASTPVKGEKSDKSGQEGGASASVDGEDSGGGRHRGASAEEEVREDRDAGSSGRHASRGGLGFARGLDGSSPSGGSGTNSGSGSSADSDSPAFGGGWLAQYGEGGEVVGAAVPNLILPGQALGFGS
ncbi:transglycosylase family protein [Streptomyces sp. NPDC005774]|uniref:transglycosylase family protein n=1 Tax=Streptomyces sp. NPDC005774 TaxID=3364728 RepID=UPI0036A30E11